MTEGALLRLWQEKRGEVEPSSFTINAAGKVAILPSGVPPSPVVYSVNGSLTITAGGAGIDQEGYLAAPLGTISLNAPTGRVYLGSGSTTTTSAADVPLLYGIIQLSTDTISLGDNIWAIPDKTKVGSYTQVSNVPAQSISLTGNEVIVSAGAGVGASGSSGSIFASRFVPSYAGSNSPLLGSYVIVPDNSVTLPGQGVYLSGMKGLPAGTYSLLPAADANGNPTQWAYLPNALIITDLGTSLSTSKATLTKDGYPIVGGYATFMGTNISSPQARSVRGETRLPRLVGRAIQYAEHDSGGSGQRDREREYHHPERDRERGASLAGYAGGTIALSGTSVFVQQTVASLPAGFGFDTAVPAGLADTLTIAASSLSNQGFQTIGLGVSDLTGSTTSVKASTVEIEPDVTLQAENIILGATKSITLDAGSQVLALALPGDTGQATFISPKGTLNIGANAVVHASNAINPRDSKHGPRPYGDARGRPQHLQCAGEHDHHLRP